MSDDVDHNTDDPEGLHPSALKKQVQRAADMRKKAAATASRQATGSHTVRCFNTLFPHVNTVTAEGLHASFAP